MKRLGIVLGSTVGACVIYFASVACSGGGSAGGMGSGSGGPVPDANAQTAPSCTSWQLAMYYQPDVLTRGPGDWPQGLSSPVTLPAGWEPIEAAPFGGTTGSTASTTGALAVVRKCAQ
ncbi:MAG TPA: hypothetical protein VIY73_25005 [Polyangiaceae bacterium]